MGDNDSDKSLVYIFYQQFLQAAEQGVILLDKNGGVVQANYVAAKLLETESENLINKNLSEIISIKSSSGKYLTIEDVYRLKEVASDEFKLFIRMSSFESTFKPVIWYPLFERDRLIGSFLVFTNTLLEHEIERMKVELLSVAAHQLRSPLGSMRWGLEMLLGGDFGDLPEQVKQQIVQLYDTDKWMITLINDLLNATRIEQGKLKEEPENTNYLQIIEAVIKQFEPDVTKKSIRLNLTAHDSDPFILIYPRQFREVVQNILSNSIKYNKVEGNVNIDVAKSDGLLRIKIADSGVGIPKQDFSKIFSKFYRGENTVNSKIEGTGLGLFVVKSYVEAWKGNINFESEEGKGSTFYIDIPYQKSKT